MTRNMFSPVVRECAVRMVGEHRADYGSEWSATAPFRTFQSSEFGVLIATGTPRGLRSRLVAMWLLQVQPGANRRSKSLRLW